MRRVLLTSISLLAFAATAAVAADLPRSMPAKAPAYVPVGYNWTGFYLGINGGYAWGQSDWSFFGGDPKPRGGLVGGTIGYNWQALGSPWVFGLEGDIQWADINGNFANLACPLGCQIKTDWFGTARGRVGYAWDRVMVYATGGAAFGDVKASINGIGTTSDTNIGWTVGAGLEGAIAQNWTAKIEYLYVDLGKTDCGVLVCAPAGGALFGGPIGSMDFTMHVVRAGVNYRF